MSLLPPNATPTEKAIEGLGTYVDGLPMVVRHLWNAATCPAAFLPWLAWALSVDIWRTDWPEATKRAVIAASPRVHRLKGSVAAVRTAVGALGVTARLIEWFQPGGSGEPYTATVDGRLAGPGAGDGGQLVDDIAAAARASAPARVRLDVRLSVQPALAIARVAHVRRPITVAWLRSSV